jgi:hypothetical protein
MAIPGGRGEPSAIITLPLRKIGVGMLGAVLGVLVGFEGVLVEGPVEGPVPIPGPADAPPPPTGALPPPFCPQAAKTAISRMAAKRMFIAYFSSSGWITAPVPPECASIMAEFSSA